ncbi:MAG TPA: hypothetical protein ENJ12_01630 [Thiolapillus brandeum]|uniref:Uncharacterized protein n=1 Tax=Thiolapillus brandeum TaxID=1076588 RepID=A0A831RWQ3_9GAMM|nr:hypothetical protein [Thiolapillus brandeum]
MKFLILGCQTMREGVVVTAVFLVVGIVLVLAGVNIVPDIAYMKHIVLFVGFILMLLAPLVLVSTFLISVLPGAKKKMDECEH